MNGIDPVMPSKRMMNDPASLDAISRAEQELGVVLPSDYKLFLREHNGGEGFFGFHFFRFWRVEELSEYNADYHVSELAPGLLLFASNGGGEGFAFDTRSPTFPIVQVPFIGMSLKDAMPVAASFQLLLDKAHERDCSLFEI